MELGKKKNELYFYEEGYFVVKFFSFLDRDKVFNFGFYIINNRFLIMKIGYMILILKKNFLDCCYYGLNFLICF